MYIANQFKGAYFNWMLYRSDIDGLRAFAVTSVVLFHLGFLPNGYLGVDIFFVISGYLITSIIFDKAEKGEFSIWDFYQRRIRRIIPLLLFTTSLALIIGIFLMLPDDLDNLAQSVFASNFSANNILMYITSSDYWSVKNEYKPLMHTWSLGVEEQYYLIYPFIFLVLQGKKSKYIQPALILLTIISFSFFYFSDNAAQKFYLLHHRFFEFSIGGLGTVFFKNWAIKSTRFSKGLMFTASLLIATVIISSVTTHSDIKIILITFGTTGLLVLGKTLQDHLPWYQAIFKNKLATTLGKISFSIYMMHQLVFAFARYAFLEEINPTWSIVLFAITIGLSFITYQWIENPFRNYQLFSFRKVVGFLVPVFIISSTAGFYIYSIGGIIKDYPALNMYKDQPNFERKLFRISTNIHIQYNENVRLLDKDFEPTDKIKVLVFGNSYGRDITNILLESEFSNKVQIRYFDIARTFEDENLKKRIQKSDKIIFAAYGFWGKEWIDKIESTHRFKLDESKIWTFGIKDYGAHNGIHYNKINEITDFNSYRTKIKDGLIETNKLLKKEWGEKYIDLIGPVTNSEGEVLVFTPEGKFLSSDTVHLTEAGARFYAKLLKNKLKEILDIQRHHHK